MRLDKYLKVSRIIKRRTLAKELCDKGRVAINGKTAKAASTVQLDDTLTIRFGTKEITARILGIKDNPRKDEASSLYEITGERRLEMDNEADNSLLDDE